MNILLQRTYSSLFRAARKAWISLVVYTTDDPHKKIFEYMIYLNSDINTAWELHELLYSVQPTI